jgi:GNAT superfamily N-acetyltransferase
MTVTNKLKDITVRRLREDELQEGDRIMRLAFGTFLGLPHPMDFMGDADYVRTRWAADPAVALAAETDGGLVGTNFITRWGSVGFFGPLTVLPSWWDQGVARALLGGTMAVFDEWGVTHRGLFTFGHSPKHISLYQSYGFLPRFLTPILEKPVSSLAEGWATEPADLIARKTRTFSSLADPEQGLVEAAQVTGSIFEGLDVRREISAVNVQNLGDTVMVYQESNLMAFAVCHVGPHTEAGTGKCFVKFGAARAGALAPLHFAWLLDACESFAADRGASTIVAGVSTGRRGAYRQLLERGYRASLIGVTLHAPDVDAYHNPDDYVLDDWR